ncbi:MAG: hypothetical protein WBG50_00930 [Desulfomonilaceae bacterium]
MKRFPVGSLVRYGAVGVALVSLLLVPGVTQARPSFCVQDNAFSISNAPGYCFAMAAFSGWYYHTHRAEPPLRKILDRKSQEQIARELQGFYSKNLVSLQAAYCNRYHGNQTESFKRFISCLITGEPRIVLLMNRGPRGAVLHAVLAYEWHPEQHLLKIYDPNYCNEERFLDLERRQYTSLDITYDAICFPEVLQTNRALLRKMESLYAFHVEPKIAVLVRNWRRAAFSPSRPLLKRERYSHGPTR